MVFLSRIFFSFFIFSVLAFAADPDCKYSFRFTNRVGESTDGVVVYAISGATSTVAINNKVNACSAWSFQYDAEGLSALSISLQSAPSTGSLNTAGTFATFAGTTVSGSNPSTTLTSAIYTATGYYPFVRISLASSTGTGSINVTLNGWKSPAYISSGSGGGGTGNPANPTTSVQYNNGGVFGGSSNLTWSNTPQTLTINPTEHNVSNTSPAIDFNNITGEGAFWDTAWRNNETGKADFGLSISHILPSNGATRMDNVLSFGFNRGASGKQVSNDHAFFFDIENSYTTGASIPQVEFYFDYQDAANTVDYRPFGITTNLNDNSIVVNVQASGFNVGNPSASYNWLGLSSTPTTGVMTFTGGVGKVTKLSFLSINADDTVLAINNSEAISKGTVAGQLSIGGGFSEVQFAKGSLPSTTDLSLTVGDQTVKRGLRWNHTTLRWEFQANTLVWYPMGSVAIPSGANTKMGSGTLVGGTVTISNTSVTANSKIFLTDTTSGSLTNVGSLVRGTITAGTGFVVSSTNPLDTSTFDYLITENP